MNNDNGTFSIVSKAKYPNFYKLLQFALTIRCGSVKSELSISVLRKIHNYNRTTMGIERFGDLSILALESELMDSIPTNEVIDYFEAMKCRKLVLH